MGFRADLWLQLVNIASMLLWIVSVNDRTTASGISKLTTGGPRIVISGLQCIKSGLYIEIWNVLDLLHNYEHIAYNNQYPEFSCTKWH